MNPTLLVFKVGEHELEAFAVERCPNTVNDLFILVLPQLPPDDLSGHHHARLRDLQRSRHPRERTSVGVLFKPRGGVD